MRKYEFTWDLIGNVKEGRGNLGIQMDVEVYRLMQFTLRDALEQRLGEKETDQVFYDAGKLAGKAFYQHVVTSSHNPIETFDEFFNALQEALKERKMGIFRVESAKENEVILTIDEDIDCSGLPILDYETCVYDEGFLSALFESFAGGSWQAQEIDCWCTGARTCRFQVKHSKDSTLDAR